MNIVVTVKHVPDPDIPPTHFEIDEVNNKVVSPPGIPPLMNGYDANALEAALQLKEQYGGTVSAITLGEDDARETLRRALAMGADSAVHVNDPQLLHSDSLSTARALAAGIRKIGTPDIVLCGRQASDTDAAQVLFGLAEALKMAVVSPVTQIRDCTDEALILERVAENGTQVVSVRLPAVVGVSSEMNEPRYPTMRNLMAAKRAQVQAWSKSDLGIEEGPNKVEVRRLYMLAQDSHVELVNGDTPEEIGRKLAEKLHEEELI